MSRKSFCGRVIPGQGLGASFTRVPWVVEQLTRKLGIDPFPGTLNLRLEGAEDLETWRGWKSYPGTTIESPSPEFCNARCYPVRLGGSLPAAVILPEVPGYPDTRVELVAAYSVREVLSLLHEDQLEVHPNRRLAVEAVIFDLDGTILDSLEAYRVCTERAVAGLDVPVTIDAVRNFMNGHESRFWQDLLESSRHRNSITLEDLIGRARRFLPAVLENYAALFPPVIEVLSALRRAGLRLGIVTGSERRVLRSVVDSEFLGLIDAIVTAEDVEKRKPDPEGLQICLSAMGLEPPQAVYVGDTIVDVRASRAANMGSIAVLGGAGSCSDLAKEGPDWVIHSLNDLQEALVI